MSEEHILSPEDAASDLRMIAGKVRIGQVDRMSVLVEGERVALGSDVKCADFLDVMAAACAIGTLSLTDWKLERDAKEIVRCTDLRLALPKWSATVRLVKR